MRFPVKNRVNRNAFNHGPCEIEDQVNEGPNYTEKELSFEKYRAANAKINQEEQQRQKMIGVQKNTHQI